MRSRPSQTGRYCPLGLLLQLARDICKGQHVRFGSEAGSQLAAESGQRNHNVSQVTSSDGSAIVTWRSPSSTT